MGGRGRVRGRGGGQGGQVTPNKIQPSKELSGDKTRIIGLKPRIMGLKPRRASTGLVGF